FDIDTGAERPPLQLPKINTWRYGLAWHPAGRLLAAAADDMKIHIWDTQTSIEAMTPWEGHNTSGISMRFNHRGDRLVSTSWGGHARLWEVNTGRLLLTLPGWHGTQFSEDDSTLGPERKGGKLRLWQLADGRELRTIRRPTAEATDVIR